MKDKLVDAPIAVASSGVLLANITHIAPLELSPEAALDRALKSGRRVFVGVVVDDNDIPDLTRKLDDAVAEIVAQLPGLAND